MAVNSFPTKFSPTELPSLEVFQGKETEHNWESRERLLEQMIRYFQVARGELNYVGLKYSSSLMDLRASCMSLPAHDPRFIISGWIRGNYEDLVQVLHSPRTQLSVRACNFVAALASFLGPGLFDGFGELTLSHLLRLAGNTKKIINGAANEAIRIVAPLLMPQRVVQVIHASAHDKNGQIRLRAVECLKIFIEKANDDLGSDSDSDDDAEEPGYGAASSRATNPTTGVSVILRLWESLGEKILPKTVTDAMPEIRSLAVSVLASFKFQLPEQVNAFIERMDPSAKKQINAILSKTRSKSNLSAAARKPVRSSIQIPIKVAPEIKSPVVNDISIPDAMGSPMKIDHEAINQQEEAEDSVESTLRLAEFEPIKELSSRVIYEEDEEVILNVRNVIKFPEFLGMKTPQKLEYQEQHSSPILKSMQDLTAELPPSPQPLLASAKSCEEASLSSVLSSGGSSSSSSSSKCIPFMLSPRKGNASLDETSSLNFVSTTTPLPQRIKLLGLAASTPLRKMYRNASDSLISFSTVAATTATVETASNSTGLLSDLIEEYSCGREAECLQKIVSLARKMNIFGEILNPSAIQSALQEAFNQGCEHDGLKCLLIECLLLNDPAALSLSGKEVITLYEGAEREFDDLCRSSLNPVVIEACIELCCNRLTEYRLTLMAGLIHAFVVTEKDAIVQLATQAMAPLLLALNHPNPTIRRLAITCLNGLQSRLGGRTSAILQLLDEAGASNASKQLIERFLRQPNK